MVSNETQPVKPYTPIDINEEGRVRLTSFLQPAKAPYPIARTGNPSYITGTSIDSIS